MMDKSGDNKYGTMDNFWVVGMVVYFCMIIIANVRVWIISKTFNIF